MCVGAQIPTSTTKTLTYASLGRRRYLNPVRRDGGDGGGGGGGDGGGGGGDGDGDDGGDWRVSRRWWR